MTGSGSFAAAITAGMAAWVLMAPSPAVLRLVELGPGAGRPTLAARLKPWLMAHGRRRQMMAARRRATVELCEGMAAELASGRAPDVALRYAAGILDAGMASHLAPAVAAAKAGDDVAAALERTATSPGADGLRLLAACWRIGAERGGTFSAVIEGLAGLLRDQEAHRDELAAHLAGPKATARLLAALPLIGLAMAAALGARPLSFLFGTLPGVACLVLGVGLDGLGLWWTRRLAAAAEGQ